MRQRTALIENKLTDLTTVLTEMEDVADSIFLMDDRRRMHMEILSEGAPREVLNLEDMLDLWPTFDGMAILATANRLRKVRAEIEALTKVNAALIRSSREILQTPVEALVRIPNPKTPMQKVYGSDGAIPRERPAVRNLLNKRG